MSYEVGRPLSAVIHIFRSYIIIFDTILRSDNLKLQNFSSSFRNKAESIFTISQNIFLKLLFKISIFFMFFSLKNFLDNHIFTLQVLYMDVHYTFSDISCLNFKQLFFYKYYLSIPQTIFLMKLISSNNMIFFKMISHKLLVAHLDSTQYPFYFSKLVTHHFQFSGIEIKNNVLEVSQIWKQLDAKYYKVTYQKWERLNFCR